MSIKLLSKAVVNQISAGEVIEKPASVVKELVENSIDAGATEITIEIKNGGTEYICVQDNGCGIKADEIKLAFTPHATSKLEKIEDLNSIATMGFRGEALATISAVSRVCIVTKTEEQETGMMVNLEGGEEKSSAEVASVTGTKIEVKDLFFNTPARLKFLRKNKTEENDITNYVEKLIMANNHIIFKYVVDGKIIYNTTRGNIIENIYTIYGRELTDNLLEVNYVLDNYKVNGYISKPEYSKANRSYQNLFVNGRFCSNALVSTAVSNAYENFTMKGKFPVYVLFLSLPQDEVDVNVHPSKLEVKFVNTQKIFRVFNDAVFKTLSDFNHIRKVDFESNDNQDSSQLDRESILQEKQYNKPVQTLNNNEGVSYSKNESEVYEKMLKACSNSIVESNKNTGSYNFRATENILPQVEIFESDLESKNLIKEPDVEVQENNFQNTTKECNVVQDNFKDVLNLEYKFLGIAFDTYLILEFEDKLFLIDQHAANERHNYDKIMNQINNNSLQIQDLLCPYVFKVNQNEADFLNNNLESLKSFGIDISEFGYNTYRVSSVPVLLSSINLAEFFQEMFDNLNSFAKTPQETIKSRFMQMACKASVKGGDRLSESEIKSLLETIKNETEVLLCPHGRPIVVEITKKQIEKWFKRIV